MGYDVQQQEGVAAVVRGQHDASPEVVDADGPHARIPCLLHGLQVQALVGVQFGDRELLKLCHRPAHPDLDLLVQDVVTVPEAVGEGELGHADLLAGLRERLQEGYYGCDPWCARCPRCSCLCEQSGQRSAPSRGQAVRDVKVSAASF